MHVTKSFLNKKSLLLPSILFFLGVKLYTSFIMAYCRRAKLALDNFGEFTSIILPKAVTRKPISRIYSTLSSTLASGKPKFPGFSTWYGRITRTTQHRPFLKFSKRYYHGDEGGHPSELDHYRSEFKRRWFQWFDWVRKDHKRGLAAVLVGSGVVVTVFFGRFETIPYSKRTHFVILKTDWEKKLGASVFNKMKEEEFKGRILPDIHPETIRVRRIAKDLVGALERGISLEQGFEVMPPLMDNNEDQKGKMVESRDIVLVDDTWIEKSRKKGQRRGSRDATSHLNGLKWEILVVDKPMVNAFCLPGGKIVVFTGLLNYFRSNAEIATIVGHEVGHAVARHSAEGITKNMWLLILQLIFVLFIDGGASAELFSKLCNILLSLPFSRRMEMEADYIGLLLLASAGYNPRLAPGVYEKLSKVAGQSPNEKDYLSTHPSGKKRAEKLSRAHIMEEALSIYQHVKSGRRVQGFL